ncbi:MAG TPA: hypothetical protein PK413_07110 [Thermoanaerobaculia bacterium]|nr:hypothetical protein [Thermoanaerobaculia bacterium]
MSLSQRPEFANPVQRETHYKLAEYLSELFEDAYHDTETHHFYVRYGSTVLEISNEPFGPEDSVVTIMAYCVQNVKLEESLMVSLLELNHHIPFGAFSVVGNDVFFSHSLFGRTLSRPSLLNAISAVATFSDDYDERIVARYGGQTALERIRDTGGFRRRAAQQGGQGGRRRK